MAYLAYLVRKTAKCGVLSGEWANKDGKVEGFSVANDRQRKSRGAGGLDVPENCLTGGLK